MQESKNDLIRGFAEYSSKEGKFSYLIFKEKNKYTIKDISENCHGVYLLYGANGCGKTTILSSLFAKTKIKFPKSIFLEGKFVSTPTRFFAQLGEKQEVIETKDIYLYGEIMLRKFKDNAMLFIDDFDKMLNDLGENFAAFLRAIIQKYNINITVTATLDTYEFTKTIISYSAPFYRFFAPIKIEYNKEDIKFIANKYRKTLEDNNIEKFVESANDNISSIETLIENYDNNIERTIQSVMLKNQDIFKEFLEEPSSQQRAILKDMYNMLSAKKTQTITIKSLSQISLLDEKIVRSQINRMVNKNFVKRIKEGKRYLYTPNILFIEREKLKLSIQHYLNAWSLEEAEKYEEAEEEYNKAIELNPKYAEAHANLGILYLKQGKTAEALKELKIALKLFKERGDIQKVKMLENYLKNS